MRPLQFRSARDGKRGKKRLGRLLSKVGEQDNKGGKQEDDNEGED